MKKLQDKWLGIFNCSAFIVTGKSTIKSIRIKYYSVHSLLTRTLTQQQQKYKQHFQCENNKKKIVVNLSTLCGFYIFLSTMSK